ncbi:hypothetical protein FGO68_gene570 [Halteria grandinella]|uniref:Uncharacterized protein n=1 Tax=Halteria grandinella TaxID=5974 RepID=A0A8J8NNH8_HALGN|nr:hypothetical protein FGO68_gene570 [Halteria grandinella]
MRSERMQMNRVHKKQGQSAQRKRFKETQRNKCQGTTRIPTNFLQWMNQVLQKQIRNPQSQRSQETMDFFLIVKQQAKMIQPIQGQPKIH